MNLAIDPNILSYFWFEHFEEFSLGLLPLVAATNPPTLWKPTKESRVVAGAVLKKIRCDQPPSFLYWISMVYIRKTLCECHRGCPGDKGSISKQSKAEKEHPKQSRPHIKQPISHYSSYTKHTHCQMSRLHGDPAARGFQLENQPSNHAQLNLPFEKARNRNLEILEIV